MKDMLSKRNPLFLPNGSVRSILALTIVGAFIAGWIAELEIVTLVVGFYFGERAGDAR